MFHIFSKGISPKGDVMVLLEIELAYYQTAITIISPLHHPPLLIQRSISIIQIKPYSVKFSDPYILTHLWPLINAAIYLFYDTMNKLDENGYMHCESNFIYLFITTLFPIQRISFVSSTNRFHSFKVEIICSS